MEFLIVKYEKGTISLNIQETLPRGTIFNSVARSMTSIILKSEGHSKNQILYLTVLPLLNKDYYYYYYYYYYFYYYYYYYMVKWYNTCTSADVIWAYNSFDNNLRIGHVFIESLKMSCSFDSDLNSISNVMRKSLWLEGHHQDSQT